MRFPMQLAATFLGSLSILSFITVALSHTNQTNRSPSQLPLYNLLDERPGDCPPCPKCFDCHYDEFKCLQYAKCSDSNGRCNCPVGFGGDNCGEPVCGSPAEGKERPVRSGDHCECAEGWTGVNCNVCTENQVCNALVKNGEGGVCYTQGLVVNENYQMCDITNEAILKQIEPRIPQATFSCNVEDQSCNFQFWVDDKESFYCGLSGCGWKNLDTSSQNKTRYECEEMSCSCISGRFLCGELGSIDITDFLAEKIRGPATFTTQSTIGGSSKDGSRFEEPSMNELISSVFGEDYISLNCTAGECLHYSEVPGWTVPVKEINTPLIAGVIAGCALFLVAVILIAWYLQRRAAYKKWGAIRLAEDMDNDTSRLMMNHKPMALQFRNIAYNLKGKQILSGISGTAQPGQIMAVMGASGAGKSTFLDILARKSKRGEVSGNMYINGEKILDNQYRNVVGYVDQEDTLLPTLTVHETIRTSALLRLPADMGISIKEQRVVEVMQQLGIHHIKDQMIGSEEGNGRGISGGEKRRVGIACELVTSPSILFLDEPTSGLDAYNAFNVVDCLVTLAKTYNRTIIFTIHQPRSNIVALFDQLILLAKGRTVYSGSFAECQSYFDTLGYSCPPGFNIADYLVDLTMHASMPRSPVLENGPVGLVTTEGLLDGSSSTRAVKSVRSIASASGASVDTSEAPNRPKHQRRISLKQKQDRQLFTRKNTADKSTPPTPRTDDEDESVTQSRRPSDWLYMSRQGANVPSQIIEDPDNLPPDANTDLDILVSGFRESSIAKNVQDDITAAVHTASSANGHAANEDVVEPVTGSIKGYRRVSIPRQFLILSQRTWRNIYRNPVLLLTHYAVALVLAVFCGWAFYGLTDDIGGFQNRLGMFFFLLALFGFSTLTSLNTFSSERAVFIRERANGYYSPISYFASKVFFDIVPLRLLPPIIMGVIIYPMTGLQPKWALFLKFMLIIILFNLAAASICFTIGIVFRDGAVANLIGSLVMLFSLLFAGLLLNLNPVEEAAKVSHGLEMLSIFHYAYEALLVNEVSKLRLVDRRYGLEIEVPGASILSAFGFDNRNLWPDIIGLAVYGSVFIIIAYLAMHFLLVEKR